MGPFRGGADRDLAQKVEDHVRNAVQRTAAHTDGFDRLTVRARLENELASLGLYLHDDWVDAVADLIRRGETRSLPTLRFRTQGRANRRRRGRQGAGIS